MVTTSKTQAALPERTESRVDQYGLTIEMRSPRSAALAMLPWLIVAAVIIGVLGGFADTVGLLIATTIMFVPAVVFVMITGPLASHVLRLEPHQLTCESKLGPFRRRVSKSKPLPADIFVHRAMGAHQVRVRGVVLDDLELPQGACFMYARLTEAEAHAIAQLMTDYLEGQSAG